MAVGRGRGNRRADVHLTGARPCYVRAALERRFGPVAALAAGLALVGCGAGERQDADEPSGSFEVEVTRASFPDRHRLAQPSELLIGVRNAGERAIPNVAVTVTGLRAARDDPALSDRWRPVFVVNGEPRELAGYPESREAGPLGCETAYVDTWACGRLRPGAERTFRWDVTAVRTGPYRLRWSVAAGLYGRSSAELEDGRRPRGRFTGTISAGVPAARAGAGAGAGAG